MKGKVYRHKKTGNDYVVVDDCCRVKMPHLSEGNGWVDGVIYKSNSLDKDIFVRTLVDFTRAFEEVKG